MSNINPVVHHIESKDILFIFEQSFKKWTYIFDDQTVQLDSIDQIGIGTNTGYGITTVVNIDARSGDVTSKYWNEPDSNIS